MPFQFGSRVFGRGGAAFRPARACLKDFRCRTRHEQPWSGHKWSRLASEPPRRKGDHRIWDGGEELSEIAAALTEERDSVAVLMKLEAPAVELHFISPFAAAGRTGL